MKKVLINTPITEEQKEILENAARGRCELIFDRNHPLDDVEVLIGHAKVSELEAAKKLQWFHYVHAGTEHFRGMKLPEGTLFTNGSGAFGVMLAEHMLAGILAHVRQLPHYASLQRAHRWERDWQEATLEGKVALILGAGDIGSEVAKRLEAFDMIVLGIRRTQEDLPYFDEIHPMAHLDQLLPLADVVVCALPGGDATIGLMNKFRLRKMKPTAILANCGRGSLIVTDDLVEVLQEGHLGGCVLDVLDPEPLPEDHPLWDMENVILTPHIGGLGFGHVAETSDKIYRLAAKNLARFLSGEPLLNIADPIVGGRK